jgi:hypothetical protein
MVRTADPRVKKVLALIGKGVEPETALQRHGNPVTINNISSESCVIVNAGRRRMPEMNLKETRGDRARRPCLLLRRAPLASSRLVPLECNSTCMRDGVV